MARVTYGPLVTELAGSIGGVTFLRNASGPIAKLRTNPTVNPSPDQSTYQTNLAKCVSYWPSLSQANKDLWDAFALAHDHTTPWGDIKTLSGYQWFLSVNLNLLLIGYLVNPVPPTWFICPPPASCTLVATSTYLRVEWSPDYDVPNSLIFYLSLPLRQSSIKLRRSLFFVLSTYNPGLLSFKDLTTNFETITNVSWRAFYSSANCSIICRIKHGHLSYGLYSAFTSAIVKIG